MCEWIKAYDPTRLVHYEADLDAKDVDMHSRMYPSVDFVESFGQDKSKTKPLVLCEYVHAMGTGPGNIKEYVDLFYKYPTLQGGWEWEFANHGLATKSKDGQTYFAYGGDFGDVPNDGNFVLDGMLNSDHTPNSGMIEYKKALEPVQVLNSSFHEINILNRYDISTLDHLECFANSVSEDGKITELGRVAIPQGIHPGATATLEIPDAAGLEACVDLSFRLKKGTMWADAGYELAWAQESLASAALLTRPTVQTTSGLTVQRQQSHLQIAGDQFQWTLDLVAGKLTSWTKRNEELLAAPLEPSFYRALTDNDTPQDGAEWKDRLLHLATLHTESVNWHEDNGEVVVTIKQKFCPPVLSWSLDLVSSYIFDSAGSMSLKVKGHPIGRNLPSTLPRTGITLGLTNDFQQVSWLGRGPGESYRDMKLSQRFGRHTVSHVDDLWTSPEYPQECSNRTDTRRLGISSNETSLTAQFFDIHVPKHRRNLSHRQHFDFMASHYDVKDIDEARHPFELEKKRKDHVILRLDSEHHGLGTGSCGPKTLDKHALKAADFEFGILLY